jgi:hypothetical protein
MDPQTNSTIRKESSNKDLFAKIMPSTKDAIDRKDFGEEELGV